MAARKAAQPNEPSPSAFKSLYVIVGQDAYLLGQETEKLLSRLLEPDQRDMALYQPEADQADGAEVLDELRTLPFLAARRVVLIKEAEPFVTKYAELLEKYLDHPSPTGVLILTVGSWDSRRRLSKKVATGTCAELIEVGEIKPWHMSGFASTCAQEKGVRLDPGAAELLVELIGNEPGRIVAEIDKLIMFKHPAKTIAKSDVEDVIGASRMFDAFEVIESLSGQDKGAAFDRLRRMFQVSRDAEYTVIGAFAFHFRRLFRCKAMIEKGESEQTAMLKAGVKFPKMQEKFIKQIRRFTLRDFGQFLAELGGMDYQAKTGQGDIPSNMEKFFLRIMNS
ncbi:DNA polymerase III subunit delta [Anaerohalosphaeraceae bacterium U12dextr]